MRNIVASVVKLVLIVGIAGCGSSVPKLPPGPREARQFPVVANRDLDLLFLIDDSPSMKDKQSNLARNFPEFIKVLSTIPGGLPSVHIGVATSDLGTQGAADSSPSFGPTIGQLGQGGCSGIGKDGTLQTFGAPVGDAFLSDVADPVTGERIRNYAGGLDQLPAVFTRMASAGAGGCGFEQTLEAVKHALAPTNTVNQGFLRPTANLGVIIVTDEDDCSLAHYAMIGRETAALGPQQSFRCTRFGVTCDQNGETPDAMNEIGAKGSCHPNDSSPYLTKVGDYATFLKGLKQDPTSIVAAAIAGTPEPVATELRPPTSNAVAIPALAHSCTYVGGDINGDGVPDAEVADPPVRIKAFLDEFENRNAFATICQQDLTAAMQHIGNLLKTAMGVPCFEGPLADVDPRTPGTQFDCTVTVVDGLGIIGDALPRCSPEDASATNRPCWHMVVDPVSCPAAEHLMPVIEGREALANQNVVVNCSLDSPPE